MNNVAIYTVIFGQCAAILMLIVELRLSRQANRRLRQELNEAHAKLVSQSVQHVNTLESLRDRLRSLEIL